MPKGAFNITLRTTAPRGAAPFALQRSLELLKPSQLRQLVQELQAKLDERALPAQLAQAVVVDRWTLLDASNQITTDEAVAVAATDQTTGITWLLASSEKTYRNDGPAEAYAKSLTALGFSDWRLPTEPELLNGPRDINSYKPAVHAPFRKGVKPEYHWSSSPGPESADYARGVSFGGGGSYINVRAYDFRVLACRGGVGAVGGVSPGQ